MSPRPSRAARTVLVVLLVSLAAAGAGPLAVAGASDATDAVDVVFLVDRSPSMGDRADVTTSTALALATEIDERPTDGRYAVIAYANERWTTLETDFTPDVDALETALRDVRYGQNSSENASLAILSALDETREPTLDLRSDATTVVVVITDEDDDGYCQLGASALAAVDDRGAHLVTVALDPPTAPDGPGAPCLEDPTRNDPRPIAEEQVERGHWVDLADPDMTPVIEALDLAEAATPTPSTTDDEPAEAYELVNASVNRSTVAVGEAVRVTATFENVGTSTGRYIVQLTDDGTRLGTQSALIDPDETHTYAWTVTPNETGQLALAVNGLDVGTVEVTDAPATTPAPSTPTAVGTDGPTATTPTADGSGDTTSTGDATAAATDQPADASVQSPTGPPGTSTFPTVGAGLGLALLLGGLVVAAMIVFGLRWGW